jgi:hypothetical protein
MKKALFLISIFSLALSPCWVWASPGPLDQFGGHNCEANCGNYGLENNEYHFHDIPVSPSYLSGYIKKPQVAILFYMPKVNETQTSISPASVIGNEINTLQQNSIYDKQLCLEADIFASGRYTDGPKVRIAPVCAERELLALNNPKVNLVTDYYKELPNIESEITKVYHYKILKDGRGVFTDMPEIVELRGLIIQGVTDNSLFYVNPNDENLALRPITIEKAIQLKGVNYKLGIVYFDDSIIYSYPITRPLL